MDVQVAILTLTYQDGTRDILIKALGRKRAGGQVHTYSDVAAMLVLGLCLRLPLLVQTQMFLVEIQPKESKMRFQRPLLAVV